jgi:hypothetical protein
MNRTAIWWDEAGSDLEQSRFPDAVPANEDSDLAGHCP